MSDPLHLEFGRDADGLRVVRQPPPAGAASFSATYVGPAGWGFDRPGEEGAARMANQLLAVAAGKLDRVALARRLDRAGATLSRQTSPEAGEVTIWGPAEEWRSLVGLLADVVIRPRFDPEDIARVRRQFLERQLRQRTQPAHRAEYEFLRAVFPAGHPYRETGIGDRRSVERLDRARLLRFHRDHYTRSPASVTVTASAPLSAIERAVRDDFGDIEVARGPELALPSVPHQRPRRVQVNLPGQSQVEIRVGGPSVALSAPTYAAAYLANEALGGRPMLSRLFQRVREERGLAYHASSHLETMRYGGIWSAAAGTGADRWKTVVRLLEEELTRLRRRGVPPAELASVRESAIGEIPLALESTADAHNLAVEVAYHGLPEDHWARWPGVLRAIDSGVVRAAIPSGFDADRSVTVVVGSVADA